MAPPVDRARRLGVRRAAGYGLMTGPPESSQAARNGISHSAPAPMKRPSGAGYAATPHRGPRTVDHAVALAARRKPLRTQRIIVIAREESEAIDRRGIPSRCQVTHDDATPRSNVREP
ncbi:hypothetical protein WR25_22142 [Diploscapter pachys]|uniref:Uncharacterized protein n=1 Tax=Diploscapter pachys TaxID=2018661 RepID=A0A2A2JZ77_9BILA|nr:hypothetical protein WR25_22142 [Diploscapter pachys]